MAVANAVPTPINFPGSGDGSYTSIGTIAVDANPSTYQTGGIPLNFFQNAIKAQRVPMTVQIVGSGGFTYQYIFGVDASAGKMKILVQDAVATNPLAELAAAAIPAGVSGDTIQYEAIWKGML